jgi:two-component system response regulator RegX3
MTHTTSLESTNRRHANDRRQVSRGGRRTFDAPGRYPPVLIADSDEGARRPLVRYLDHFGFEVEEAVTGAAAVSIVERSRPQVAIAEITLPHDDGFRTRVRDLGIPYIVTATDDMGAVPPDAAAVLLKPFHLAALLHEVRRVLRTSAVAARGVL